MWNANFPSQSIRSFGWKVKYCYSVGHVFNDLCGSLFFSYILIFLEKVLHISPFKAGLVLMVAQLADGFSTSIVSVLQDRNSPSRIFEHYGKRKVWHMIGTAIVSLSFPFIFLPCMGCHHAEENVQVLYYCAFVIVFQFGWACVQISHLSLIPELSPLRYVRTELNSMRYGFTLLSILSIYVATYFSLKSSGFTESTYYEVLFSKNTINGTSEYDVSTIKSGNAKEFRSMAAFCVSVGLFFTGVFHVGVREPYKGNEEKRGENGNGMQRKDWLKQITFYQVAGLHLTARLLVNIYQAFIPLYALDSLNLNKTTMATVPLSLYLAGFLSSVIMKKLNKLTGRKGAFTIGCLFGLSGCMWIASPSSADFKCWGVYCAASLLGIGGSTVFITSSSITADLIGFNVESVAFVYGFMNVIGKIGTAIAIVIIEYTYSPSKLFYRNVIIAGCGIPCILGIVIAATLNEASIGWRTGTNDSNLKQKAKETTEINEDCRCLLQQPVVKAPEGIFTIYNPKNIV